MKDIISIREIGKQNINKNLFANALVGLFIVAFVIISGCIGELATEEPKPTIEKPNNKTAGYYIPEVPVVTIISCEGLTGGDKDVCETAVRKKDGTLCDKILDAEGRN